MSDLEQHIKRINDKLQQLLKNYQLLQKQNIQQSELIKQLKESKEKDNQQITILQEKISILKAATGKMNEADKKEFEKNINQYIREIDKCIGILSE
jgi:Ni,Fe-hydrogenase maturation factor